MVLFPWPVARDGMVIPMAVAYWGVPSGGLVQAGETVSVLSLLEDTVRVWPAPVPAVMLTRRPAHSSVVHDLSTSWSVVLVCPRTYWDVSSGGLLQARETVSVLTVLEDTVRVWPAPLPAVILTKYPAHWSGVHTLLLSLSVVLVCVPVAVPSSPVPVPLSPERTVPSS